MTAESFHNSALRTLQAGLLIFASAVAGCISVQQRNRSETLNPIRGHKIPALELGAVPQGLSYREEENQLLISAYFTDDRPSCIFSIDWKTGELLQTTELKEPDGNWHCDHVGGIAIDSTNLWIASGSNLYQYNLNDFLSHDEATALEKYTTEATENVAFCAQNGETTWVGEFALKGKYPTHTNHHMGGRSGSSRSGWIISHDFTRGSASPRATPKKVLSIPDRTQGIAFSNDYIFLSSSYGRRVSSTIEVYQNPLAETPHQTVRTSTGENVPCWFLDNENLVNTIKLPPMSENIQLIGDQLVVLFESGAKKYQWLGKSPQNHLLLLNVTDLIPK